MPPKNPNAEQVLDAIQQTRKEVILPAVPHAETDWKIWRFKLIKKVRARLLPMKQKEGMEEIVTRYLRNLEDGVSMTIPPELEAVDADYANAMIDALQGHPSCATIEGETMNNNVVDAITTLKIMDQYIRTGTEQGVKSLAMNDMLHIPYPVGGDVQKYLVDFKTAAKDAGYAPGGTHDALLVSLLTAKMREDERFRSMISNFEQTPQVEQTTAKLELATRKTLASLADGRKLGHNNQRRTQPGMMQAALFDSSGNPVQAYVMAHDTPQQKPKGGPKGGRETRQRSWRTPVEEGVCPYHVNLISGCNRGNDCPLKHSGGPPGWGYKPPEKGAKSTSKGGSAYVSQLNQREQRQPNEDVDDRSAMKDRIEHIIKCVSSSVKTHLVDSVIALINEYVQEYFMIDMFPRAERKVGKMHVVQENDGFHLVTKGAKRRYQKQVGETGEAGGQIGKFEGLSDSDDEMDELLEVPDSLKAKKSCFVPQASMKKKTFFVPKMKRKSQKKSTTGIKIDWSNLDQEIARAKAMDTADAQIDKKPSDTKLPRIKRFDENYPKDIHESINLVIDEVVETIEAEQQDIWNKYFPGVAPAAPLLVGMVGMVGDTGASEHNISGPNCWSVPLKNPVALKTAAGTIHVDRGAAIIHPVLGRLNGLNIKEAPNLLSLGRLVENGYKFYWESLENPHLVDMKGNVISFKNENYVPILYPTSSPVCYGNIKIHDEFTHLGPSSNCDTCKMAKMKEKAFLKRNILTDDERETMRKSRKELKFNHHLTFDSFGQVPRDINNNEFGTIGLCSNTGFIYFAPKRVNEPKETLDNLKGFLTKDALIDVNSCHTDNGIEFKAEFDDFLQENHVQHQWGTPNRPVSNGLIERQVGELKRGIRALLLEAKLPVQFWSYAAAVWVFNRNRRLAVAQHLPQYNRKPLRFGQRIFAKKSDVSHTFEPTAAPAIFIGYKHQGVLAVDEMYLKATGKVKFMTCEAYSEPTNPVFPGFPGVLDPTELNVFLNCDICGKSRVPDGHPVTCTACLNKGKRGRPGTHTLTVGCELSRCTCVHNFEIVAPDYPLRNDAQDLDEDDEHFVDQDDSSEPVAPLQPDNNIEVAVENSPDAPSSHWSVYDMYDIDYVDIPAVASTSPLVENASTVRNLIDQFDAPGGPPVAPANDPAAADINSVQPNQLPHRGLYSSSHSHLTKMPLYSTTFSLSSADGDVDMSPIFQKDVERFEENCFAGCAFVAQQIHKNDPRYHCEEAIAARKREFDRMLQFKCFDLNKPIESRNVPKSATIITPLMLTHIKDVGTPIEKFKGRFVADGRRVPRYKQFSPPMALNMKRAADINSLLGSGSADTHGVVTADMTNGYLHADLDPSIEIYMRVPPEFQTDEMKSMLDPCVRVWKAMNGLPSAGFDFAKYTHEVVTEQFGYSKMAGFPSMYTKRINGKLIVLGFYVDDLYMTGDLTLCRSEMEKLGTIFTLGSINDTQNFKFLGIDRVSKNGEMGRSYVPVYSEASLRIQRNCRHRNASKITCTQHTWTWT